MQKVLHHIRKQPLHIRKRYMYITVSVCAAIVILLWIIALGYRFSKIEIAPEIKRQQNAIESLQNNRTPIPDDINDLQSEAVQSRY